MRMVTVMHWHRIRTIGSTAAMAGLFAGAAISGVQAQQPISLGQSAADGSGWSFNVAPYLWMATINANLNQNLPAQLAGTVNSAPSIGFGDLLRHLNFATMIVADARYDRFSFLTDFIYMNLSAAPAQFKSFNIPGATATPISAGLHASEGLNVNASVWTLAGGYTLAEGGWGNLDMIAGFRYLALNTRTNYNLGLTVTDLVGNQTTVGRIGSATSNGEVWNGIGGFRGRIHLPDTPLFIPYYVDIGAGGSKLTWQAASGLGYHTSWADLSGLM